MKKMNIFYTKPGTQSVFHKVVTKEFQLPIFCSTHDIPGDIAKSRLFERALRPSNTGNIFHTTCRTTMLRCKLRWFVARITTSLRNKFFCCKKQTSLQLFATEKLGHFFAWPFLLINFLTSQFKLIFYLFPFKSELLLFVVELLLRSQQSLVTLGKLQQTGSFVCLGYLVNNFSSIPIQTQSCTFSI